MHQSTNPLTLEVDIYQCDRVFCCFTYFVCRMKILGFKFWYICLPWFYLVETQMKGLKKKRMLYNFSSQHLRTLSNVSKIFCKLKKHQKAWMSFFASLKTSKNMNFIFFFFASLKNLKKPEFHFLQASKTQKTCISFFASLKKLKKHEFHFLQAKNLKKYEFHFLQA